MLSLSELLIKYIIKNKVYFSDFSDINIWMSKSDKENLDDENPDDEDLSKINPDMVNFISTITPGSRQGFFFDLFQQVKLIKNAYFFLRDVSKKKQPILFFGINKVNVGRENSILISELNREIFQLCFSFIAGNKKVTTRRRVLISDHFDLFYCHFYHFFKNEIFKNSEIIFHFENFENFIKLLVKAKFIKINGNFLDSWGAGSASNYRWFKSVLKSTLDKDVVDNDIIVDELMITERFHNLKSLSSVIGKSGKKKPGAVVLFSRVNYDYVFSEFKKIGVPIICVVNVNQSLKDIDYPLLGDSSLRIIIHFYIRIIKLALES